MAHMAKRIYRLRTQLWLPRRRPEIFSFFADPKNLERLTPPWLRFEILTPQPIAMGLGARLQYRLRLHGFPVRWESEIAVWDPPHRFVDRQMAGPYRVWVHEHCFCDQNRGTLIRDTVVYSPLGGSLVQKLLIAPDLKRIFRYRREVLRRLFNQDQQKSTEMKTNGSS